MTLQPTQSKPKRKKNNRKAVAVVPGTTSAPQIVGKRRRSKKKRPASAPGEGDIRIKRNELVREIKTSAAGEYKDQFDLNPTSFTFLKNLYGSFERYRWHKIHVYYKPAVGTTTDGLVSYGFDYTLSKTGLSRPQISALTPNTSHAVWADSTARPLVVSNAMLMSRAWYVDGGDSVDKSTARCCIAANSSPSKVLGEIWVSYDIQMSGTRA